MNYSLIMRVAIHQPISRLAVKVAVLCLLPCIACFSVENEMLPSLKKNVSTFSQFPDQIDAGMTQPKDWLKEQWGCPSANVFSWPDGPELAVCGSLESTSFFDGAYIIYSGRSSDFSWIIEKEKTGTTRLLWIGGGWGSNYEFIKPEKNRTFLIIEGLLENPRYDSLFERLPDKPRYDSVFETPIQCGNEACEVNKKRCAINIPKDRYPDVIQRVKLETHKTFDSMPEDQYCALVMNYSHGLLLRALAGDQEAAKLINQFPFQVDGGLAELVQAHQDTYKEAEWLGCVGVR